MRKEHSISSFSILKTERNGLFQISEVFFAGVTTVTLYDTLGADSIDYILNQTSIRTVVCSADKIKGLIDIKAAGKLPLVSHIIHFR
jgi:long-subunit acyl-CoA synthetase (AMP-forming)